MSRLSVSVQSLHAAKENGYGREQKFLDISFHNRLAFGLVII